jgi:hypothetical protein
MMLVSLDDWVAMGVDAQIALVGWLLKSCGCWAKS